MALEPTWLQDEKMNAQQEFAKDALMNPPENVTPIRNVEQNWGRRRRREQSLETETSPAASPPAGVGKT